MKKLILLIAMMPLFAYGQTCVPEDIYAVEDANAVCYEIVDNVRHFYTNNYPDHTDSYNSPFDLLTSDAEYSICAYPEEASEFTPLYEETETTKGCTFTYTFGVGVNGVKYDPSSAEYFENTSTGENNIDWHVEARYIFSANFGNNGGHLNPFGEYHYHDVPADYFADDLSIDGSAHSPIVGYSADGFPMYYKYIYSDPEDNTSAIMEAGSGYTLKSGTRPGDGVSAPDGDYTGLYYEDYEYFSANTVLDECNGRYGVTPEYPYGTYYYVLTDTYPYIPRCFKGTSVDNTFRVGPGPSCPESTAETDCAVAVAGCMDPFSTNYNPNANVDDGSCTYSSTCETSIFVASQVDASCFGEADGTVTISVSGFGDTPTYEWTDGGTSESRTGLAAGTYTVTVSGDDCTDELEITITEPAEITYSVSATDATCGGTDGTLTFAASGGAGTDYEYSIDNGSTYQGSGLFDNLAAGSYSVLIQESSSGCEITASGTVGESGAPDAPATSGDASYCFGETLAAMTATGGNGTLTWYADADLSTALATGGAYMPGESIGTTVYYVTETLDNCESVASSVSITVNALPEVQALADNTAICAGESVTLTGSGAATYLWDQGITDGEAFIPEATATYTLTGTSSEGCSSSDQITITVLNLPEVSASASATTLCSGETVTLTGSGALTYEWSQGVEDGIAFTLEETTTFTVTGTNSDGCTASAEITINVEDAEVQANTSSESICLGESVTLSGSGATTYSWSGGIIDGVPFSPEETTTYTVTGTGDNGCSASDEITIVVNMLPTVVASATSLSVCSGEEITLTGSGADTYMWDHNVTDGESFIIALTTTFTVTGTDANGCTASDAITITVNEAPQITATASTTEICAGETVTLSGSGGTTYEWDNGVTDGVPFTPTQTTTYTVVGTDDHGCSGTAQLTITVNQAPMVTASSTATTLCKGESITLTGSGASSYTWSGEVEDGVPFAPTASGVYTVTGTDTNGCSASADITLTVVDVQVEIHSEDSKLIASATAGVTYQWINCASNTPIEGANAEEFSPEKSGGYAVIAEMNGCSVTSSCLEVSIMVLESEPTAAWAEIYPNPMLEKLSITNPDGEPLHVEIINLSGERLVQTTLKQSQTFDVSTWKTGIYLVHLTSAHQESWTRVIKD
ncbi:MAG: YHYH protein [Marinoscillum sp.]|uniref:YHYH protein n=1 Tax=Marinoscillum sp. TaxID=2024838 RepID=UPI0032FF8F30